MVGFYVKVKYMDMLLIISVMLFAANFIAACIRLKRLPKSAYEVATAFDYPERILWFVCVWGGLALAAPALIDATPEQYQFLSYIAIASGIVFGMCAHLDSKVDRTITTIAGWLCIFTTIICVVLFLTSKL
jgi:hypothetical protein